MVKTHTGCHPRCQRQSGDISKCMLCYLIERNVKESQCLVLWFPLLVNIKAAPAAPCNACFMLILDQITPSFIFFLEPAEMTWVVSELAGLSDHCWRCVWTCIPFLDFLNSKTDWKPSGLFRQSMTLIIKSNLQEEIGSSPTPQICGGVMFICVATGNHLLLLCSTSSALHLRNEILTITLSTSWT